MHVAVYDAKQLLPRILTKPGSGLALCFRALQKTADHLCVYAAQPLRVSGFHDRPLHRVTGDLSRYDTVIAINSMEPFFLSRSAPGMFVYCLYPEDRHCMTVFSSFKYKYYVDGFLFENQTGVTQAARSFDLLPRKNFTGRQFIRRFLQARGKAAHKKFIARHQALQSGIQSFRLRDYAGALALLKSSNDVEAQLISGFCNLKLQNWIQASTHFAFCMEKKVCLSDACFGQALVHLVTGNLRRGIHFLIRARRHQAAHAEASLTLDLLAERLGLPRDKEPPQTASGIGLADPEFLFTVM